MKLGKQVVALADPKCTIVGDCGAVRGKWQGRAEEWSRRNSSRKGGNKWRRRRK